MTDETVLPPDPAEENDLDEDDGENEPVEGDTSEMDVTDEPDVRTAEVPADAF